MELYIVEFMMVGESDTLKNNFNHKKQAIKKVNSIIGNSKQKLVGITEVDTESKGFAEMEPFIDHEYELDFMYKKY